MDTFSAPPVGAPPTEDFFQALFAISLTGLVLLQPVWAPGHAQVQDFAYVRLNPAAQRLLGLPECPGITMLTRYPHTAPTAIFEFYAEAFRSGQPRRWAGHYSHDGLDSHYWLAAQRSGDYLVVSFADVAELSQLAAEGPPARPAAPAGPPPAPSLPLASAPAAAPDSPDEAKSRQHLHDLNAELVLLNVELSAAAAQLASSQQQVRQLTHSFEARVQERTQGLETANEQLARANRDLDYFVHSASHDLRAPIANLEGLLNELDRVVGASHPLRPTLQPLLTLMHGAVQRFQQTIGHLTDISRVGQPGGPPAEPLDVAAVVAGVQLDLAPLIAQTGAHVATDVGSCVPLRLSAKHLRAVVYNLLSNALKYRAPERAPAVHISCHATATAVELRVQDNGLGLSAAQQAQLFTLFRRLHYHVEGSGVGLYLIKKMLENAGGTLTVQSEPGVGSTFTASLPRD